MVNLNDKLASYLMCLYSIFVHAQIVSFCARQLNCTAI